MCNISTNATAAPREGDGCANHHVAPLIRDNYPEYWGMHTYPADQCACIRKVAEDWGILGNFAPAELTVEGVKFNCTEQLFQMMKFRDAYILNELHGLGGMGLKMKAKRYETTHRRGDWGMIFIDVLKFCLQTKYEQCAAFRAELQRSAGLYIVEDQTSRPNRNPDAWGVKLRGDHYEGPNLLGELLMELRDNGRLNYHLPPDAMEFISLLQ